MTVKELLDAIETTIEEPVTLDELMDMEVKIRVPHSTGQYTINTTPKRVDCIPRWDNVDKKNKGILTIDCNYIK